MKARLVRIGSSQGIRIPKAVIEKCGFGERVALRVEGNRLIITPAKATREGWDEAFARMAETSDAPLLLPHDLDHTFDQTEWEW